MNNDLLHEEWWEIIANEWIVVFQVDQLLRLNRNFKFKLEFSTGVEVYSLSS